VLAPSPPLGDADAEEVAPEEVGVAGSVCIENICSVDDDWPSTTGYQHSAIGRVLHGAEQGSWIVTARDSPLETRPNTKTFLNNAIFAIIVYINACSEVRVGCLMRMRLDCLYKGIL
jgi:hypothetical protein